MDLLIYAFSSAVVPFHSCMAVYEKFKEGTVKDISEELPFEIPEGWVWARLEHCLISLHTGLNPRRFFRLNTADAKNYYVTIRELKSNKVVFSDRTDRINDEALRLCNNRSDLDEGDVLFAGTGSIGVMALIEEKPTNWNIKEGVYALKPSQSSISPRFLLYALQSEAIRSLFMQKAVGSTIASVPMKSLLSLCIPLPPLAEQKRIVAKIEKLMPLVEEYGKMEETRLQLDADLPAMLEKSILQEAIQGKLVPQDPNDEPASELLKRIAAERKALVKAGKLKRDKGESVIFRGSDRLAYETRNGVTVCIQDEIPFEIPDSWEWVRLGDILHPMTSKHPSGEMFGYIDIDAIDNKQHIVRATKRLPVKGATSRASREIKAGDVLFSMVRPYLRNVALISEQHAHCIASTGFYVCRPTTALYPRFLYHLLLSDYVIMGLNVQMKGLNSPGVTTNDVASFLIPLPPLNEQKRIVKRVEELKATARTLVTF